MSLDTLFAQFLKEKRYLQNVAENTIYFYERCFIAWKQTMKEEGITKLSINQFVIGMREAGRSPAVCDAYIRGFNVFLSWLHENGQIPEKLAIKRLKLEKRVMKTFPEASLRAIINYRPKGFYEYRTHAMIMASLDTGARIDELLTLKREEIDFDNLLILLHGKGNKQRIVPMSLELRKILYRFLKKHRHSLVFCTKQGCKLMYDNTRRNFNTLLDKAGVDKVDGTWHSLRRTFATNYIKENGNPLKLQRLLGHTTLRQTNEYVKLVTEDLQEESHRTSILNRLR
jgi:integrase/recombinase XerD